MIPIKSKLQLFLSTDTEEIKSLLINELKFIINEIGHFPTLRELSKIDKNRIGEPKLVGKINSNGGINHFRKIMGYPMIREVWNEERAIKELNIIIDKLGHFPLTNELLINTSLRHYIANHNGINYYRKKLGYEIIRNRERFSEEYIIDELNSIIEKTGEFPIADLIRDKPYFSQLDYHGGINHFRKIMGYDLSWGRWDEEKYINELKVVVNKIDRFPTGTDLLNMNNFHLLNEIRKHGGFKKVREDLAHLFPEHIMKNKRSAIASYINIRGLNSEKIVKELINKWCYAHNLPQPEFNVRLSKGNVIEFVCEAKLRIGIDVTNTKTRNSSSIRKKWRKKEYHLHLDELWIVVFTDTFTDLDYIKFNKESPDNVKVMSVETFMKELRITVDDNLQLKIDNYNTCTFHNKDDFSIPKLGLSKFFKFKPDIRIEVKK